MVHSGICLQISMSQNQSYVLGLTQSNDCHVQTTAQTTVERERMSLNVTLKAGTHILQVYMIHYDSSDKKMLIFRTYFIHI